MIPRGFLTLLVLGLPVAIVAFAVIMGGFALAHATGDVLGANIMWYIAMGCIAIGLLDALLLLCFLGLEILLRNDDDEENGAGPG